MAVHEVTDLLRRTDDPDHWAGSPLGSEAGGGHRRSSRGTEDLCAGVRCPR
jgi:hypothetical protein